jgi:hypothetical protein
MRKFVDLKRSCKHVERQPSTVLQVAQCVLMGTAPLCCPNWMASQRQGQSQAGVERGRPWARTSLWTEEQSRAPPLRLRLKPPLTLARGWFRKARGASVPVS